MTKPVSSASKKTKVRKIVELMDQNNFGAVPVMEEEKLIGIITERDIVRRVVAKNLDIDNINAEEIMTKDVVTVTHDSTLLEATRIMSENNFRSLPVINKGKVVGIVTATDIIEVMSA